MFKHIVKNKTVCVFVSPHHDDAILSCGGLISYLSKRTKVIVINVFTDGGDNPYSLSAKKFLELNNYKDAKKLFKARRTEDSKVFGSININPVNLGFLTGLFRKKENPTFLERILGKLLPELLCIYPTFYLHLKKGKIAKEDQELLIKLHRKLKEIIKSESLVFCPLGVGNHTDHIVVREVCSNNFSKVVYWTDFPYSLDCVPDKNFVAEKKLKKIKFNNNWFQKLTLIKGYKTQMKTLFPNGKIPKVKEIYYAKIRS